MAFDKQIEMINKLKELVDAGILTKEEFEKRDNGIMKRPIKRPVGDLRGVAM
jgi:hypothetical protein